jgi:hypothetical protein
MIIVYSGLPIVRIWIANDIRNWKQIINHYKEAECGGSYMIDILYKNKITQKDNLSGKKGNTNQKNNFT